jgi:hypothetical protein
VIRRSAHLVLAPTVAALLALGPAAAAEEAETADPAGTPAVVEPADGPAVVIPDVSAEPDDPAWTFRYLVPTLLVVSGLALLGVAVFYGVRVKGRYRVAR